MLAVPSSAVTIRRGVDVGGSSLTSNPWRGTGSRVPSAPASATETRITPPPWAPARWSAPASAMSTSTAATHRVLSERLGSCRPVEAAFVTIYVPQNVRYRPASAGGGLVNSALSRESS